MKSEDLELCRQAHGRICCSMAQVQLSTGPAVVLKDGRVFQHKLIYQLNKEQSSK